MAEELLDIVDDNDIVLGREPRSTVHKVGLQHRGVHVFLFTTDGKMLVQKRSADRASSPSMLDCSVSEHVKAGESYREAAIRGMKEELGLEGGEIERLTKFRMNYGVNDNEISELFQGIVEPGDVKFDPIEIETIAYLGMDELKRMLRDGNIKFCAWFVELLNLYLNGKGKMQVME
jgi:isopentenyl-diphosphate Delta-isomerase